MKTNPVYSSRPRFFESFNASRRFRATCAAFAVAIGCTAAVGQSSPAAANVPTSAEQVVAMINQTRAQAGVCPLALDLGLTHVASVWSTHLAASNALAHNGSGIGVLFSGENVGYGSDLSNVHQTFVGSPMHYANITSRSFNRVGVGAVASGSRLFVTYDFGASAQPC